VGDGTILRLFAFRPARSDSAFDATLRDDVLPGLLALPGLVDAFVGRPGPAEDQEPVIASVWRSRRAMSRDLESSSLLAPFQPDQEPEIVASRLDILPVAVAIRPDRVEPPAIIRVYRGEVRPGELDEYVQDVRSGALADVQTNEGLVALYLGAQAPARFITVSAWTGWSAVERATGGNVRHPIATRHAHRLVAAEVDHYEILPNTARPHVPARGRAAGTQEAAGVARAKT
jgi:hypothetical protein